MLLELQKEKYNHIWAHISVSSKETLFEHTNLVCDYFCKIAKIHQLNKAIDNLITGVVEKMQNKESMKNLLKDFFYTTPQFHDVGKLNPNFQTEKMGNELFKKVKLSFGSDHSKTGAFLFIQNFLKQANHSKYTDNEKMINLFILFAFSFTISKHHASKFEYFNEYYFNNEFVNEICSFLDEDCFLAFPKHTQENIGKMFDQKILLKVKELYLSDPFTLFALLKLNYSLLTASDYYATTHFMNNWDGLNEDFGVFTKNLKRKIITNIETSQPYNKLTYQEFENYNFEFPNETSFDNLNKLRQNLAFEVISGIRENRDQNLFYIEAPTGGGKTNLSMLALAEFLRNDLNETKNEITKIFYVFPFTTLITQTFKTLIDTLGLENDEIVQIHSKAGFSQKSNDDKYGKEKENIIDYLFVNYPIALLSHIKFFDILKSNKKSDNYLLHRLANSIVIIDELQTYSPKQWDKVIYFINKYAYYFNIRFILMSATLPKIDKLLSEKSAFEKEDFIYLNKNKNNYFHNSNFKKRVDFNFSLLSNPDFDKNNKELFLAKLWNRVKEESINFKKQNVENRVHTIIEFIFKRSAGDFLRHVLKNKQWFDEIFILSGTTLEPRRKEIIDKLKSDSLRYKTVLLITTQVVEAGVDIDMDIGFKDSSLVDSDEQLAGRINRNVKKWNCKLFLFDYDDAKSIYGKDYRFKQLQDELQNNYFEILEMKNFDLLYNSVMDYKNKHNHQLDFDDNLPAYLKYMKNLNFSSVNSNFQLIENSHHTATLFAPLEIPIKISESENLNFNENELEFLKKKNVFNNADIFIDGEKVWKLYCDIIENKDEDFTKQRVDQIIIQGILAKFSFSISLNSKEMKMIKTSGNVEEQYGFYKLHNVNEIYDYETGIKELKFEDIHFW